jgi:septal ring factor EnvC (AmiA/AmiB activator)
MSEEITHQFPNNGFAAILTRLDSLDSRMVALEDRLDRRLQETRPIWEQVLKRLDGVEAELEGIKTRLDGVETRLGGVETRLGGVETRLGKVEHELYAWGKKFRVFNQEILNLQNA